MMKLFDMLDLMVILFKIIIFNMVNFVEDMNSLNILTI